MCHHSARAIGSVGLHPPLCPRNVTQDLPPTSCTRVVTAMRQDRNLDLIATEALRTAILFKWLAYGESLWRAQLLELLLYASSWAGGVAMLLTASIQRGSASQCFGYALLTVSIAINGRYTREMLRSLVASRSGSFSHHGQNRLHFGRFRQTVSTLGLLSVYALPAMLYNESSLQSMRACAALGTVLQMPRFMLVARGFDEVRRCKKPRPCTICYRMIASVETRLHPHHDGLCPTRSLPQALPPFAHSSISSS